MSDLRKTINRLLRGDKPTANSRWVTTRGTSVWDEAAQRYVSGDSEGYWYEGDWSLAMDTSPVWVTGGWRFRKDDGSEATATYYQAEDTNVPKTDGINAGTAFRFRIAAGESAKANLNNVGSWTLQFNNDDTPGWNTVGAATDVSFYDSANLINGTAITVSRLTAAAGTTWASGFGDECEDGVSSSQTYANREGAEVEYALILDSGVLEDAVITFRLLDPEGNPITLTGVPQLIVAGAAADQTADGSPSVTKYTASGSAIRELPSDGSPSITKPTADGSAIRELPADGSPSITKPTSDGSASIVLDTTTADGSPSITPITAAGVAEIIREAAGSASISPITASGNSFIWPKVYLNTSESLSGATEMTVASANAAGTSITFDDSVGAPVGALFLGVENRINGDVGWIAVTVTESVGPTVVFGGLGA